MTVEELAEQLIETCALQQKCATFAKNVIYTDVSDTEDADVSILTDGNVTLLQVHDKPNMNLTLDEFLTARERLDDYARVTDHANRMFDSEKLRLVAQISSVASDPYGDEYDDTTEQLYRTLQRKRELSKRRENVIRECETLCGPLASAVRETLERSFTITPMFGYDAALPFIDGETVADVAAIASACKVMDGHVTLNGVNLGNEQKIATFMHALVEKAHTDWLGVPMYGTLPESPLQT